MEGVSFSDSDIVLSWNERRPTVGTFASTGPPRASNPLHAVQQPVIGLPGHDLLLLDQRVFFTKQELFAGERFPQPGFRVSVFGKLALIARDAAAFGGVR